MNSRLKHTDFIQLLELRQDVSLDKTLFELSSHQRAREAIAFGLAIRKQGFHVFVIGEDRCGRISSTLEFLKEKVTELPLASDWIYVNNFDEPHRSKPFRLSPGQGRVFKEKMEELVKDAKSLLMKMLSGGHYLKKIETLSSSLHIQFNNQFQDIQNKAKDLGINVFQTSDGFKIDPVEGSSPTLDNVQEIQDHLHTLSMYFHQESQKVQKKVEKIKEEKAHQVLNPLFQRMSQEFGLDEWLTSVRSDMVKRIDLFISEDSHGFIPNEWYGVNVIVDQSGRNHPLVILEAQPTQENIFGEIKYRAMPHMETNFTMIRPGSLHRAYGGILILRADSLVKNPDLWEDLKASIRDRRLRIKSSYREQSLPLIDAPDPESIPLDVQIFLVGSPAWYYGFFCADPDFKSYFKIKAEIDHDMPITACNVDVYTSLIQQESLRLTGEVLDKEALHYLICYSSRLVENTGKLNAQFELIRDIMHEAVVLGMPLTKESLMKTILNRRDRNNRMEDYSYTAIQEGHLIIQTQGHMIGQVNGLTVMGADNHYGVPARITARTYAGEGGVMNIERLIDLSGPIQQKGTFIIEGFLNGLFAQSFPLPCGISLTFEQNYGDVEGDSASLGELIAILSSLSGIPIRQDLAITGSMDQIGRAQSVGGIHHKVEGFYRACKMKGLTGKQGVVIPQSNVINLTLKEDVLESIEKEEFFIASVQTIYEAIELMLETPCGLTLNHGLPTNFKTHFAPNSVFDRAFRQLKQYRKSITTKDLHTGWKQ